MQPPPRLRGQGSASYVQMGDAFRRDGNPTSRTAMIQRSSPNGKVVLEGYREAISNGFEGEKPRFNPVRLCRSVQSNRRSADINSQTPRVLSHRSSSTLMILYKYTSLLRLPCMTAQSMSCSPKKKLTSSNVRSSS